MQSEFNWNVPGTELRLARRDDQPAIIALIDSVYREYGDQVCLEGAESDLLNIEECYRKKGGEFVVVTKEGSVVASHAILPIKPAEGTCTFRRLYLVSELRGIGLGEQLMRWAMFEGAKRGFSRVEFWSDVRFRRAHSFFRRLGFESNGEVRTMNDGHAPYSEFFFFRSLTDQPSFRRESRASAAIIQTQEEKS